MSSGRGLKASSVPQEAGIEPATGSLEVARKDNCFNGHSGGIAQQDEISVCRNGLVAWHANLELLDVHGKIQLSRSEIKCQHLVIANNRNNLGAYFPRVIFY